MKQTNNAIKFLMAQYRAIFKNAYIKGLTSAVVLTATLAAGQANAEGLANWGTLTGKLSKAEASITINGKKDNEPQSEYKNISIATGITSSKLQGNLNITGGNSSIADSSGTPNLLKFTGASAIEVGSKNFSLNINDESGTGAIKTGLTIQADSSSNVTHKLITKEINITKGRLDLVQTKETNDKAGLQVDVTALTIGQAGTISKPTDRNAILNIGSGDDTTFATNASKDFIVGTNQADSNSQSIDTTITLNSTGKVIFGGSAAENAVLQGKLNAQGGLLDFTSGSGTLKAVTSYEGIDITEGNQPGTDLDIIVGAGKSGTIALNSYTDKSVNPNVTHRGVLNFGAGSVIELQQTQNASGGFLDISKDLTQSAQAGSVVKFEAGSVITVKNTGTTPTGTESGSYIGIAGSGATAGHPEQLTDVYFDSGVLGSFLTADKVLDNDGLDSAGSILLKSNANLHVAGHTLNINEKEAAIGIDPKDNELNLTIKSGDIPAINDIKNGGLIHFTGKDNTIYADTIKIAGKITGTNTGTHDISFSAKDLVVGSASHKSSTPTALNFTQATASNSITFVPGSTADADDKGVFTLKDPVKAYNENYFVKPNNECDPLTKNTKTHLITGDFIVDSDASNNGSLTVQGGSWESASNITIKSGTVSVKPTNSSNPASLTLTGDVVFNKNNTANIDTAQLEVKGASSASAVLDLTEATLYTAKNATGTAISGGLISVSGNSTLTPISPDSDDKLHQYYTNNSDEGLYDGQIGWGVVKITANQLDRVLLGHDKAASQVGIFIQNNGVVKVEDFGSAEYNVNKFTHAANASGAAGTVRFKDSATNAILDLGDGRLTITAVSGSETNEKLNFKGGTIAVKDIIFNTKTADKNENPAAKSTFEAGTLNIGTSVLTYNSELTLGDGTTNNVATLNLSAGASGSGTISIAPKKDASGTITTDGVLNITSGSAVNVVSGKWDAKAVDISGAGTITVQSTKDENGDLVGASFTADNYAQATTGKLTVEKKASATFNSMQLAKNTAGDSLTVNGHLTINGVTFAEDASKSDDPATKAAKTAGINFNNANVTVSGAGAVLEFGKTATAGLLDLTNANSSDNTTSLTIKDGGIKNAEFDVKEFGQVKFNFTEGTTLDKYDVGALVGTILSGSTTGYLNLTNANLNINTVKRTDGSGYYDANWSDIEPFAQVVGHATNKMLLNTVVTVEKNVSGGVRGHFAAFNQADRNTLIIGGPTSLHHADANGGYFVSYDGKETDVKLDTNGALALANGGKIGSIYGEKESGNVIDKDGNVVEGGLNSVYIYNKAEGAKSLTEVLGSIKDVNELGISADTQVREDINAHTVFVDTASSLEVGKTLTASQLDVEAGSQAKALNTTITSKGVVMGKSTTTETLNINDATNKTASKLRIYGGEVYTKDLVLGGAQNNTEREIEVGTGVNGKTDDPNTIYDETKTYSGLLEVTGTTTLNNGTISSVAEKDAGVSFVSLNKLTNYSDTTAQKAGVLDGDLYIGQHGVAGVGVENLASLKGELSNFYNGAALTNQDAQSILYLGKSFVIGKDDAVILTSQEYDTFAKYIADSNAKNTGTDRLNTDCTDVKGQNVLYMGDNTTIVVSESVAQNADMKRLSDKATAMIGFEGNKDQYSGKGIVIADGGHIFVNGNVRASQYKVFDNATIEYLDNKTPYRAETANEEKDIYVSTENNFLNGYVEKDGTVSLQIDKNGRAIMAGASDPVYNTLVAYVRGYNGPEPTTPTVPSEPKPEQGQKAAADTTPPAPEVDVHPGVHKSNWLYSYDKNGKVDYNNYHNEFLQQTIATGDGTAVESATRLGVYGGAAQVALVAGNTTTDAIAGRMGMGLNAAQLSQADNGQGAGFWVSPVYRSSESDSFGAQGVNYGVDVDIYGVALGGDITLTNGLRVGAMFNVGSGETSGKGAAANVSNDFNYYGFGAYVGYSMNKFSVVGDVSYTVADNDIDANTSIEKVGSSLDSSNLSLGVTGQYNLVLGNDVLVTPHLGLRYSQIDLDSYTVKGANDVAYFDAKKLNVFSVPVGVTFAKEFVGESWTVKPSVDLTLTGNFGDDSLDGETYWAGVENLVTKTSTEVLDNFTYGVTAGFTAKTGSFSMGLGINYTGSSNTDEFGINANARFTF